jgi:hypothetical protein
LGIGSSIRGVCSLFRCHCRCHKSKLVAKRSNVKAEPRRAAPDAPSGKETK